jgi:2-succinyl-6-hydroxy-2,4-cyclohexadiene-1-carboxylate synthase
VHLHAESGGDGPRVALVHGFTQTGRCWGPVATDLARDHEVVRVDAPGHGRSATVRAGLPDGADLVADRVGRATYLGYSMGGRLCLHLALRHPEVARGLVLVGATAGIEDAHERGVRRERDRQLAVRLRELGVPAFLDEWLAQPLFASLPPDAACVPERLENRVDGLASSLELAGTGAQEPLWDDLHRIEVPVLVTSGEHDTKFTAIGRRVAETIGANARFATVPGAGHTAHLEQPEAFLAVLRPWLAAHDL